MPKTRLLNRRRALWFGTMALASMGATAIGKAQNLSYRIQALAQSNRDFTVSRGGASLKERAAAKGLIYGAAARSDQLLSDASLATRFAQECDMLIPEWELKWSAGKNPLRPDPDSFDFKAADLMANFAQTHGLLCRGHTLVWHQSLPRWFKETVNRQNAEQFLVKHIRTVMGYYAGQMHSWDVVNEAIEPNDGQANGLRKNPWLEFLGPDYIDLAFRVAAAVDPQAMLVYNDYGLEYEQHEARMTAVLKLLERLKSKGTPIHALGIQAHLWGGATRFNPKKLRDFLSNVASLGLKIMITELDVVDKQLPLDVVQRDRLVAADYEDYLSVVLDETAVIAVLTWGLSDRYTWISEFYPRSDKAPVRPLPLDANLKPKLAWNAIARAFDSAPRRESRK